MSSVQVFQERVRRRLAAAGMMFDEIDSYGQLVSARLLLEKVNQPPRLYAYGVLDVFPEGEVYDYFPVTGLDGRDYLVVRFTPGKMTGPQVEPVIKVERQWVKGEPPVKRTGKPQAKPRQAVQPKPAPQPEPAPVVAAETSQADQGLPWAVGQIAWTIIPKADGSRLKQARCRVVTVGREQAEVEITKTGQRLPVPVSQLFDHVPQPVGPTWQ